jgi:hypothetical protein
MLAIKICVSVGALAFLLFGVPLAMLFKDSSPLLWSVLFFVWMAEFVVLLVFGVRELIRRDRIGMRYLKAAINQNLIAKRRISISLLVATLIAGVLAAAVALGGGSSLVPWGIGLGIACMTLLVIWIAFEILTGLLTVRQHLVVDEYLLRYYQTVIEDWPPPEELPADSPRFIPLLIAGNLEECVECTTSYRIFVYYEICGRPFLDRLYVEEPAYRDLQVKLEAGSPPARLLTGILVNPDLPSIVVRELDEVIEKGHPYLGNRASQSVRYARSQPASFKSEMKSYVAPVNVLGEALVGGNETVSRPTAVPVARRRWPDWPASRAWGRG